MGDEEQMLDDCETLESKLSDWERGFVTSLRERLDSGNDLTENQSEKLFEVHDRVVSPT